MLILLQIRMLQPVRAKRPPPPPSARKQPPPASSSSTNNLDFSIKTLDQIRAEKKKKQQQRADGDDADRREGDVTGIKTNRTNTTLLLVPQTGDKDVGLKEEREEDGEGEEEGESDSGNELPKMVAPQKRKRKVVIKRSTLRKNADSALLSTAESAKSSDQETGPSPKKKRTTDEISTSESQTLEPYFDATCIDRSAPLPDNHQEQRESKLTLHSTRATFDDYATLCFKNTAQRKKINLQQPSQHQSQPSRRQNRP
jgi:hypothetical protein